MGAFTGDKNSVLFQSLSGFWQRFFADAADLEAFYQASETYLGQVYLDLMSSVLGTGLVDTPVFNKEQWKLLAFDETEVDFVKGATDAEDRYVYNPPGEIVNLTTLQNTIFDPQVVLDNGVDFDVTDNDGLIRFREDPFQATINSNGQYMPQNGIAWRQVVKTVGHRFYDARTTSASTTWDWETKGVKRGDTLRFLGRLSETPYDDSITDAIMIPITGSTDWRFYSPTASAFLASSVGDVVRVLRETSGVTTVPEFYGYYTVKTKTSDNELLLDGRAIPIELPTTAPTPALTCQLFRCACLPEPFDSQVDYIRGWFSVGPADNPYPLDTLTAPWVYSVVRDIPDNQVVGYPLTGWTSSGALPAAPLSLGNRHLVRGTVKVSAKVSVISGLETVIESVQEGRDYAVDYTNGTITQLTFWLASSYGRVKYEFKQELVLSVGGVVEQYTQARDLVQISLWAPEVQVDRRTLANNFGVFLNRFQASSETYKEYLRGIVSLYVNGPVFKRMESALNVIGNYPVIAADGEVLQSYDSGVWAEGTGAEISAINSSVTVDPADHEFSDDDLGAYLVLSGDTPSVNQGKFQVVGVDTATNTAFVTTEYGFVDDVTGVDWVLTRTDQQEVTTNQRTYTYAFDVPLRTDIQDPGNYGKLFFQAFDALTTVFTVVDYIEDPTWWHGLTIPKDLWSENSQTRRTAYTRLVENIVDPDDTACIDDPGLYIDASETGQILESGVPVYRHSAAYLLFDRYLKAHTFHIQIAADVALIPTFQQDLQELILISKPAYTYPFVGTTDIYVDTLGLYDEALTIELLLTMGVSYDADGGYLDTIQADTNYLRVDDDAPFVVDDMFNYPGWDTYPAVTMDGYQDQVVASGTLVTAGQTITLVPSTNGTITSISIPATRASDGAEVLEGRDYTVDWRVDSVTAWRITILVNWTPLISDLTIRFREVLHVGAGTFTDYEEGWSPILVDGTNPWYIRAGALNPEDVGSDGYAAQLPRLRTEHTDRPLWIRVDTAGV